MNYIRGQQPNLSEAQILSACQFHYDGLVRLEGAVRAGDQMIRIKRKYDKLLDLIVC